MSLRCHWVRFCKGEEDFRWQFSELVERKNKHREGLVTSRLQMAGEEQRSPGMEGDEVQALQFPAVTLESHSCQGSDAASKHNS